MNNVPKDTLPVQSMCTVVLTKANMDIIDMIFKDNASAERHEQDKSSWPKFKTYSFEGQRRQGFE